MMEEISFDEGESQILLIENSKLQLILTFCEIKYPYKNLVWPLDHSTIVPS